MLDGPPVERRVLLWNRGGHRPVARTPRASLLSAGATTHPPWQEARRGSRSVVRAGRPTPELGEENACVPLLLGRADGLALRSPPPPHRDARRRRRRRPAAPCRLPSRVRRGPLVAGSRGADPVRPPHDAAPGGDGAARARRYPGAQARTQGRRRRYAPRCPAQHPQEARVDLGAQLGPARRDRSTAVLSPPCLQPTDPVSLVPQP